MTDKEIRGYVLKYFYDKRRENYVSAPEISEFKGQITYKEIVDIIEQLRQNGLLEWHEIKFTSGSSAFVRKGKITASGVDIIESGGNPPIAITL